MASSAIQRTIEKIRAAIANHGPAFIAAAVVMFCFMWMTTYGTFEVFEPEHFGQFYDAQASALLAGHWDVPPKDIFPEGFYRNGKAYGYFGFVPAIPRMLLNRLLPGMSGAWSRLSAIVACAVTLACCYSLLRRARQSIGHSPPNKQHRFADAAFLLLAGLGSTVIYLGSRAFIYDEAMLWAVALSLCCYVQVLDYLATLKWRHLFAACVMTYLAFFTRISSGLGPMLALLMLATSFLYRMLPRRAGTARHERQRRAVPALHKTSCVGHGALIAATLAAIVLTYVIINHAKFGTWFQPAPMRLHEQVAFDPARLARTGGHWMSLGNVPTTSYAYLSPGSITFHREFPWLFLRQNLRLFPGQHIDGWGAFSSVLTAMPVFVVLGLIGLGFIMFGGKRARAANPGDRPLVSPTIILLGSLSPIAAVLAFSSVDNRYLHEFFPLFIVSSAYGLKGLLSVKKLAIKILLVMLLLIGGAVQVYANCAYALVYQRLLVYDAPMGPANQFRHWQQAIDRVLEHG